MKIKTIMWGTLFLISVVWLVAINVTKNEVSPKNNVVVSTPTPTPTPPNCNVTDYGRNVIYFDCVQGNFAVTLSLYLADHPLVRVASVVGNTSDISGGGDIGYFVVFRAATYNETEHGN